MRQDQINENISRLSFCFFYRYSRFEYALKANGYLRKCKIGRPAKPDWRKLAKNKCHGYSVSAEAKKIISASPKRQVVAANNEIEWEDVDLSKCPSDLHKVVCLLQTIRNNLFHGGKVGDQGWDDHERTEMLLELGIAVLDQIARLSDIEEDYLRRY